jgi:hypothetical protein
MFNLLVGVTGGGSCQKEVRCWHMRAAEPRCSAPPPAHLSRVLNGKLCVPDTCALQVLLAGITGAVAGAISMAMSEFIGIRDSAFNTAFCEL